MAEQAQKETNCRCCTCLSHLWWWDGVSSVCAHEVLSEVPEGASDAQILHTFNSHRPHLEPLTEVPSTIVRSLSRWPNCGGRVWQSKCHSCNLQTFEKAWASDNVCGAGYGPALDAYEEETSKVPACQATYDGDLQVAWKVIRLAAEKYGRKD